MEAHPRKHRFREGGRQDNGKWRPVALTGAKRRKSVVELARGPTIGYNEAAANEARKAVMDFGITTLKP